MTPLVIAIEPGPPLHECKRFGALVSDCLTALPVPTLILWWDCQVTQVSTYGGPTATPPRIRHGGSDSRCVFDWIAKALPFGPLGLVLFTDGYTVFPPTAPSYPVAWVLTQHHCPVNEIPFGDVSVLTKGGTE